MSKILFSHSYFYKFDPKQWKAKQPYPPLGTLYGAAYLRSKGYEVLDAHISVLAGARFRKLREIDLWMF